MLITNGKLISLGEDFVVKEGQAILVKEGLIAEIGSQEEMIHNHPDGKLLDANGQYIMPGNICAHTHFYGAYARGLSIPGDAPQDFPEILKKLWWPLDKALDEDSVRASALVHLVDAIKHGTTTLFDHHASPNFIDGSLDVIAEAVDKSGLRAVLCYEVTDRDGEEKARAGIAENLRFRKQIREQAIANGRIGATFGLHASMTLSDATLEACRAALPQGDGYHIHVAEHEADEQDSLERSKLRVVQRLKQHGILGPQSIAAHCIHIDDTEIALLNESETWVTHQPRSNMNNGVGVAAVETMLNEGIRVCLGNDGFTQDMWTEWKIAYLLHKVHHRDPRRMNGMDVVEMAVTNNAKLAAAFLPETQLGVLATGAKADLIFVDYQPFTPITAGNVPWHILFGFNESMVTTSIVDGQLVMRDRIVQTLDEQAIAEEALSLAPEVWKRYNDIAARD